MVIVFLLDCTYTKLYLIVINMLNWFLKMGI